LHGACKASCPTPAAAVEDIVACWAQGDAACSFKGTDMPAIMVHVAGQNSHNSKSAYAGFSSKTTTLYL
jgi:hypothetical protein